MVVPRRQWALALLAAVGLHLLAGLLAWLPQQTQTPPPEQAPRGVMVSLDSFEPGSRPAQPTTPAPVEGATAPPAAPRAPPAAPQPATPIEPAPEPSATALPIGPEPAEPPDSTRRGAARNEAGAAIPVANTVTIRSADTAEMIRPEAQVTARSPADAELDRSNAAQDIGSGTNGSSERATADYITRLRAWLSRHKYYPEEARRARAEGTVRLYIAVDRYGQVLSYSIEGSAGNAALDRAAREMVERAEPLPAMPDATQRTRLELIVPVNFTLEE